MAFHHNKNFICVVFYFFFRNITDIYHYQKSLQKNLGDSATFKSISVPSSIHYLGSISKKKYLIVKMPLFVYFYR